MTGTGVDPYPEREITPEGQDPEVVYPRDLGQTHIGLEEKKSMKMIPNDFLLFSQIDG